MSGRGMDIDAALAEVSMMADKIGELKAILERLNSNGVHIAVLIDPMKVIAPGTLESPRFVPEDSPPPGPSIGPVEIAEKMFEAILQAKHSKPCADFPLARDSVVSIFRSERSVLLEIFAAVLKIDDQIKRRRGDK